MNLGSAFGTIELKSDGVVRGAKAAASALRDFESQTAGTGKNLDKIGQSGEKAGAQVASGATKASAAVKTLAASTQDVGASFDKLGGAAALLGGALAAGLGAAVKSAADLETVVAKVSTIAPEIDTSQVTSALSDMSTRVAQTSVQLAESLNQIFSSIDTNQGDALKLTEEFGRGAVAASTDAQTFGTAVLGVMNAYGLSVDQASHVSDVFFNTINKGVVSGDELALGLGQVTQQAKLAGVSFDELGALIAGVTREGGSASTNITNLQNVLSKITTAPVQEGLAGLGIATREADGSIRGILPVLTDLKAALAGLSEGERTDVLAKLFPDVQARAGIATLLSQLDTITQVAGDNATAAGTAAAAYEKMGATAAAQAQILRNTFTATLNEIGTAALPTAVAVAGKLRDVLQSFNTLDAGTQNAIVGFAAFSAAALLSVAALVKIVGAASSAVTALRAISAAAAAAGVSLATLQTGVVLLGSVGIALAAIAIPLEALIRVLSDGEQGITSTGSGFLKYIDNLDLATSSTSAFIAAHKNDTDLKSFDTEVQKLRDHLAELAKESAQFADPSKASLLDLFTFGAFNRNLEMGQTQKAIDLLVEYKLKTEEAAKALADLTATEDFRRRFMGGAAGPVARSDFGTQGPVAVPLDPAAAEAAAKAAREAAVAAADLSTAVARYVQVGSDAIAVDNDQAVAKLALTNAFAAQQAKMQETATAVAPLNAALTQLAAKQAAGIPLTAREAELWGQLPGVLGAAQSATQDLTIASAETAVKMIAASGGVGAFGGAAGSSTAGIDKLRGALILLNEAFGALGQADAQDTGFFNLFQQRIDVLEAAQKAGTIDAAGLAELETLKNAQLELANALGVRAAKERELALAIIEGNKANTAATVALQNVQKAGQDAGKNLAGALGANDPTGFLGGLVAGHQPPPTVVTPVIDPAGAAAVQGFFTNIAKPITVPVIISQTLQQQGFDSATMEALGITGDGKNITSTQTVTLNVTDNATGPINSVKALLTEYALLQPDVALKATDNATTTVGILIGNIDNIPTDHNTVLTVADQATQTVLTLIDLINSVPTSLHVTANVDTSGAVAAIQELRNMMPSSPAKEGPFRTLPDWHSIFETLEPAGDDAVRTLGGIIDQMGQGLASGMDDLAAEQAKKAADLTSSIANAVKSAAEALTALRSFTAPDAGRFTSLREALGPVMAAFAEDAKGLEKDALEAVSAYAETVGKVLSVVGAATTALGGLREFRRPSDQAIDSFRDSAQYLINVMAQVAADSDQKFVAAAGDYAESATKVVSFVSAATAALVGLGKFKRPSDRAMLDFRDSVQFMINLMVQVAADSEQQAVSAAGDYADSALKVVQFVAAATTALTGLGDFERPTDQAVRSFRDVAQFAMNLIAQVAADGEEQAVAGAAQYAEAAQKVFGFIATATGALVGLQDFVRPTDAAVRAFAGAAQFAVDAIAAVAAATNAEMVDAAAAYAEDAQKVVSLIGAGVAAFKALAEGDFIPPDPGRLRQFAQATLEAVLAIEEASRSIDSKGVDAAAKYSEGANRVVALIGAGIAAFKDFSSFTPPSAQQIAQLKSVISATVIAVAQAAGELSADAVKAAGEYADGAGKAVSLLGTAIGAFGGLDKWVAPSQEAIREVVAVTQFAVQQLAGIAGSFSKDQLAKLSEFGSSASAGFGALRGALDAGKALEGEHIAPADAIGKVLGEFQAGLAPLAALAAVSEQYKTQGALIGSNVAQAYAAIAGSLPGFTPQSAAASATVTGNITNQQQVIHHFEGDIKFSFLAANGQWIVTSLQVDDKALTGTADLIAGKIAEGFAGLAAGTGA